MLRRARLYALIWGLCLASTAHAQSPSSITYQGRLTDPSGAPITSATQVTFTIYDAATGGTALWNEGLAVSPDAEGIFSVELGTLVPLDATIFDGSKRYLGIQVGSDPEMTPRQPITAVPYALRAGAAPTGGGGTVTSVGTGAGLTGGPITTTGTISIATNGVTASMLAPGSVGSSEIADGSITNADINAAAAIAIGKISGAPGVEFRAIGSSLNIPTTTRNLGSITMSIPTSGFVVLLGKATAVTFGDATLLQFGLGTSTTAMDIDASNVGVLDGNGTQRREFSPTVVGVVSVTPGSRTFYLNALKPSVFSANQINLGDIYLTGVFVPLRY